ncbi:MAG: TIGR04076 family protein [Candidatus Methanomethylophilaceae archaeon]|nr:TIGR04076 family protein [Candidatus Methanomethylophilaceae archaeon]
MKHKVKVTVIDKKLYPELQEEYCSDPRSGPCPCYNVGDEFVFERDERSDHFWHGGLNTLVRTAGDPDKVAGGPRMPHCSEAWDAISRYIYAGLQGGSIMRGWMKDERVMIACCSDGTRPVIFKIERIDEEEGMEGREERPSPAPVPPAPAPGPESDRQDAIAAKLFGSGRGAEPAQRGAPPEPKSAPTQPPEPAGTGPELPAVSESPAPWDPPTAGDFVPTLDFGRYWRLNYSYLSAEEKKAYEAMEEAILRGFPSVKVDLPADPNRLAMVLKSLIQDNWSLFYVETSATSITDPEGVFVGFRYNRYKDDRASWLKAMKEVARNVFEARVKGCRTRYEAEMAIHDFLTGSVTYDKSDPETAYNPLGPLLWNKGVCEGISEAFTFLASACGLKAAMTSGKLKAGNHRWNIVEIDGERYNVDVTSDLSGIHAYLNCSDDLISKSHTLSRRMGCGTDRLYYHKLNGSMFKNSYEAGGYIEAQSAKGKGTMFEFALEYGANTSEITRIARKGAGGSVAITVYNMDNRFFRVAIR